MQPAFKTLTSRTLLLTVAVATLAGCGTNSLYTHIGRVEASQVEASKATLAKRLIVGFDRMPTQAALNTAATAGGVTVVKRLDKLAMVVVETRADLKAARAALLKASGVVFVEAELLPELEQPKTQRVSAPIRQGGGDPLREKQWYLDTMGIPKVWDATAATLKTVTVAVVDTGVDLKHPDLQGVLVPGFNAANPGQPPQDEAGHGTMTSGLVGAIANNGQGIAGVAPNAKIMPCKVGNSASSVVEAMMYAADHADMITMSLSFKPNMSEYPVAVETTRRAAEYVMSKNVPMVCSMGNTGTSSKNVPSYFAGKEVPGLIAVGATDRADKVTSFSTFGNWTSVSAPGQGIITTAMGGQYNAVDGTSFSTPITAGVVALMLGHGAAKDPAAIKAQLQKTSLDIETPGYDDKAGAGRVDAFRAVTEAAGKR